MWLTGVHTMWGNVTKVRVKAICCVWKGLSSATCHLSSVGFSAAADVRSSGSFLMAWNSHTRQRLIRRPIWRRSEWQPAVAMHSSGHRHCLIAGGCPLIFSQKISGHNPKMICPAERTSMKGKKQKEASPGISTASRLLVSRGVFWDIWPKATSRAMQRHARKRLNVTGPDTWTQARCSYCVLQRWWEKESKMNIHSNWSLEKKEAGSDKK